MNREIRFIVEHETRPGSDVIERHWFTADGCAAAWEVAKRSADKTGVREFQLYSVTPIGERK